MRLKAIDIAQQAREEPEKWLLLRELDRGFVGLSEDQNHDGEDFGKIVNLGRHVGRIAIVLDHEHNQSRERVDGLEGSSIVSGSGVLGPLLDTGLSADAEEE